MDKFKERTGIYHEHQQGALCAQHALNNLLQAQIFLADALADIARELDADEKSVLTHKSFKSENMDDTGFFSIQVLQRALKIFEIELVPLGSQEPIAKQARNTPGSIQAYICNLGLHWFTIRRFGKQYFNLNSLYYAPELISNIMLLKYLKLVEENGYSVFIVHGNLPVCVADEQLSINPIGISEYRSLTKDLPKFIMDDKIIENLKDLPRRKNGDFVVQLPRDLMEEFKKNPDNPHIRELIYSQIPEDVLNEEMSKDADCSNPNHNHPRPKILISVMPDEFSDEQFMEGTCDCEYHRQRSQGVTPHFTEHVIDGPVIHNPNERHLKLQTTTPHFTEHVIDGPVIDNPNERHLKPQMITPHFTEHVIKDPVINNSNERQRQPQMITTRYTEQMTDDPNIFNSNERQPQMITTRYTEQMTDDPNIFNSNERQPQMIITRYTEQMTDDPNIFNSNERERQPQIITQHLTQVLIARSNSNNPNEPPQQQIIAARQVFVLSRSSQRSNTLIDSPDIQQMTNPSIGPQSEDDYLLHHAMAQSLLETSATDEDINNFFFDEQSEQLYQHSLDKAIAASLITNNSTIEQSKETPEVIPITNMNSLPTPAMNSEPEVIPITNMNSSPTPAMNSEPETIKMPSASTTSSPPPTNTYLPPSSNTHSPSLTNTHSPPSTDTPSSPLTNTYSPSPTNTSSPPPPTNMYSTPPTDTSSLPKTTTNSPSPIVTNIDVVESPSVEELRQRRLQFYGNRDRSIISTQSDFND